VTSQSGAAAAIEAWRAADAVTRDHAEAAGLEPALVKACLVGPGDLGWAADPTGDGVARRRATLAAAEQLHDLIAELFRAGAPVVQLEERCVTRLAPDDDAERGLLRDAWARSLGDPAGHVSLALLGGSAEAAGAALLYDAPFASYLFDLITGPDSWRVAASAPQDRGLIVGVADARVPSPDSEPVLIWGARYASSLGGRGPGRVGLAPSAGLETLPRAAANRKLAALAEAARKATLPVEQLASEIEPRAVDARSAALGRYEPRARRRR
jgi:methionine synthase II (cobalamin-independent)